MLPQYEIVNVQLQRVKDKTEGLHDTRYLLRQLLILNKITQTTTAANANTNAANATTKL
jgi:hypothetical protein